MEVLGLLEGCCQRQLREDVRVGLNYCPPSATSQPRAEQCYRGLMPKQLQIAFWGLFAVSDTIVAFGIRGHQLITLAIVEAPTICR